MLHGMEDLANEFQPGANELFKILKHIYLVLRFGNLNINTHLNIKISNLTPPLFLYMRHMLVCRVKKKRWVHTMNFGRTFSLALKKLVITPFRLWQFRNTLIMDPSDKIGRASCRERV